MSDIAFSVLIGNGYDDIIFKTIMLKGDKGNSVDHISKTGTSGKVDTYTIYLTDGTIGGTFTVTNGEDGAPVNIDDDDITFDKAWSSMKIYTMIGDVGIDDAHVGNDRLWSSDKISSMIPQTETIENVDIASFNDGADDVPLSEFVVDIDAVQVGSGTPSPINEREIFGWSSCHVNKSGVNLWDEEWELGGIDGNTGVNTTDNTRIRSKNHIPVVPNTVYCFSIGGTSASKAVFYYGADKNFISYGWTNTLTLAIPNDTYYIRFYLTPQYGTTYNNDISINYPSTDTSYHASNGGTDTIDFGQTVFGGTLNVLTGELIVTHGIVDLSTISWTYASDAKRWRAIKSDMKNYQSRSDDIIFEKYETDTSATIGSENKGYISGAYIYINSTDDTAQPNGNACYPLATPIRIQLTPTEVRTLANDNNIFADTGKVKKLVYFKTGFESIARLIEAYLRGE